MKGAKINYSQTELDWIKKNKSLIRSKAHARFIDKFNRQDVSLANYTALCKRNNWLTGRTGRYEKGAVPLNKGKKMPFNANSTRTQFKPGQLPHNTNFIGHERLSKDGYVEISVAETNPHTGADRRYVVKHRHNWEKINGPVPEGHALKCIDGDKTNCDPSNWMLVDRGILPRLNNRWGRDYDNAPAEIKPTILGVAKLEHKVSKLKNGGPKKHKKAGRPFKEVNVQ